ncbi:MAG TPA: T9SS type A sorting domain-containing protein [Flavobacteriales bacterium]|nr:T9SS type A sorting domain-containing protein [Flavobacteriales bacterium]
MTKRYSMNRTPGAWRYLVLPILPVLMAGQLTAQSTVIIGAGSGANTVSTYPCPLGNKLQSQRAQYLYTAAELNAAGITANSLITEAGWVVNARAMTGHLLTDYTIAMMNTGTTSLSDVSWEAGATTVYGPANYSYPSNFGGNILFALNGGGFVYTGGNLLVEVCNNSTGASNNPTIQWTTGLGFNAQHTYSANATPLCGTANTTNTGTLTTRPRLVLTSLPPDCLGVPGGSALPGNTCDDGDPNTTGDVWDASCECTGTPCGGNIVVVVIKTDDYAEDITWEILDDSNNQVATGGPGAGQNNMEVQESVCLGNSPGNMCYRFILNDGFGDGIDGGFWELRTATGGLLLRDAFDGVADGDYSPASSPASPAYGNGHSFCLPLGPVHIAPDECNVFNNLLGNKVYCNKLTGAANYQFEFSDPDAGFIRRIARPNNYVAFGDMVSNPLTPGVKYFARVRTDKNGPMASAHWGTGCEMGIALQALGCSGLIQAPAYGHSCNEVRSFNTNNSFIYASPIQGGTEYQFHIYNAGEGYDETFSRNTYILQLKWNGNVAPPLMNGSTYQVEVNVKVNGLWSGFCAANTCSITIDNNPVLVNRSAQMETGAASIWPNPVRDGRVNLNIEGIQADKQHIRVDIKDVHGIHVAGQSFENYGERFNTVLDLPGHIANGVYMVHISINGEPTIKRFSLIR